MYLAPDPQQQCFNAMCITAETLSHMLSQMFKILTSLTFKHSNTNDFKTDMFYCKNVLKGKIAKFL